MTDTTQAATSSRKSVSKRQYKDAKGEKSIGPDANGSVEYVLLGDDGKTPLKSWTLDSKGPGLLQFAQFGFVTKVGNVANSVLNGDDPGGRQDAADEVDAFLDALANGTWREPGEGGPRGPKYDRDVLAAAIVHVLADKAAGDAAYYKAKLDDKSYHAKARGNTKVMAKYHADMAAREDQSADALA